MDLKNLKTFTDKLCDKDIAMFHHCLSKEWSKLHDYQESIKRSFKAHQKPRDTFNNNVHDRSNQLLQELECELQYLENLMNYCKEFFNYPKQTEFHFYKSEPEVGTNHINNTI